MSCVWNSLNKPLNSAIKLHWHDKSSFYTKQRIYALKISEQAEHVCFDSKIEIWETGITSAARSPHKRSKKPYSNVIGSSPPHR